MCGIAGMIGKIDELVMGVMLKKITHRGDTIPKYRQIGDSILGCAHLRIVDLKNSSQPIFNEEESVCVVFNGEIYNYIELKKDIESKGHCFKTISDTEVLVHLYEEYKENMLLYLDGMFAFLIYDSNTQTFFGARDYFGVKPFFYCWVDDVFYFSSEMKSFENIPTNNIFELGPSQYIKNGVVSEYYCITSKSINITTFHEAKGMVRRLVTNAVKKRVQTKLPIGVLFSGGIDSTITLHLSMQYHNNVTALILGDENAKDVQYAKRYCKEHKVKYRQKSINVKQLLKTIPNTIRVIESFEPNLVRGAVLSCVLGKLANELKLKVVLCGEGADEIFAGYGDFLSIDDENDFQNLSHGLLKDLYRTQLLRVDRTAMAYGVEVREPFLDKNLVEYALSLPSNMKVGFLPSGKKTTKLVLREAFNDVLPNDICERPKMTLMEGSGVSTVNPGEGVFFEYANYKLTDAEFEKIRDRYPDFRLSNKEEAYYFKYFYKYFSKASFASKRTINAQKEIQ